ncbi:hypothetical protein SPDO_20880 [Sphingomonas dokdonensis]|uniref:Uncharacterized protein n=1 Tax=Sphingomonas dokdonensis TaxID=344880 RepID=A0A245ZKY5_9SPHN|nr:hypothetical protein SPDO_20880 [Sphingomonas dokdonensis]
MPVNHRVGTTFLAVAAILAAGAPVAFAQAAAPAPYMLAAQEPIAEAKRVFGS